MPKPRLLDDEQQTRDGADEGAPRALCRALADVAVVLQAGNDDQQRDGGPLPMRPAQARRDGNGEQHAQADARAMDVPRMPIAPVRIAHEAEQRKKGCRQFHGAGRTNGNRHKQDRCRFWGVPYTGWAPSWGRCLAAVRFGGNRHGKTSGFP